MSAVMERTPAPADVDSNESSRYARTIKASKRVRWDIDADVLAGRRFDFGHKFLPDALARIDSFTTLSGAEKRLISQVQGRTYAYIFGLVERYIGAKVLELSGQHWLGDQVALEALVRFSDEELKHQELFRRVESMIAADMPPGYRMTADPNAVARAVLSKSTWAVLALTCDIELFTQVHYQQSIAEDASLSPLWKDVFRYHWMEEAQHAVLDELEWVREDRRLTPEQRDAAVDDLIQLVGAVDGILQVQSAADAEYFARICGRPMGSGEVASIRASLLKAYRWQYVESGVGHPHFGKLLTSMVTPAQMERIGGALAPLLGN
jgi:hypothetical protein